MNDPVALLLVVGFIDWLQQPAYGALDMALLFLVKLSLGTASASASAGLPAAPSSGSTRRRPGPIPVASIATAGIAYGSTEVLGGSGLLAVYFTALTLGPATFPGGGRRRLSPGPRLGGPDRPLLHARAARLPQRSRRLAVEGLLLSAVLIVSRDRSRRWPRPCSAPSTFASG